MALPAESRMARALNAATHARGMNLAAATLPGLMAPLCPDTSSEKRGTIKFMGDGGDGGGVPSRKPVLSPWESGAPTLGWRGSAQDTDKLNSCQVVAGIRGTFKSAPHLPPKSVPIITPTK